MVILTLNVNVISHLVPTSTGNLKQSAIEHACTVQITWSSCFSHCSTCRRWYLCSILGKLEIFWECLYGTLWKIHYDFSNIRQEVTVKEDNKRWICLKYRIKVLPNFCWKIWACFCEPYIFTLDSRHKMTSQFLMKTFLMNMFSNSWSPLMKEFVHREGGGK